MSDRLAAKVQAIVAGVRGRPIHEWANRFGDLETSLLLHPAESFALVAPWIDDADAQVRRWAAAMLVRLDRRAARAALEPLLGDADPDVRWIAADVTGDLEALWSLAADKPYLVRAALARLAEIAAPGTAERLAAMLPERDAGRRTAIFAALGALGEPGAAALLALAAHPDDQTRARACGRLDDPEILLERLGDPSDDVSLVAALRLARLGRDEARPALIDRLSTGRGSRAAVIDALARLPPSADIEAALIEVVDDHAGDPGGALRAALALARIGTARCVPALERFLDGARLTKRQRRAARILAPSIARLRR